MYHAAHPEVLAREWIPPLLTGRAGEVQRLLSALWPHPRPGRSATALVVGPAGSGTSVLARFVARRLADQLANSEGGARPMLLDVPVGLVHGTHGVATRLLQAFDEGFSGRGFPANEILAGFLRRLRRSGRPAVIVLDGIGPAAPDLAPVLRGLSDPDRFLPEGQEGIPPLWTLAAGRSEGLAAVATLRASALALPPVELTPYGAAELFEVLADRASRALGHPAPPAALELIVRRALGREAPMPAAVDALRALFGSGEADRPGLTSADGQPPASDVEPRLLSLIEELSLRGPARVGRLRQAEAELALRQGHRPLPATTFWRRLVRLEAAGLVRRSVRPGGPGGTSSVVELLAPAGSLRSTLGRSPRSAAASFGAAGRSPAPSAGLSRPGRVGPGGPA